MKEQHDRDPAKLESRHTEHSTHGGLNAVGCNTTIASQKLLTV